MSVIDEMRLGEVLAEDSGELDPTGPQAAVAVVFRSGNRGPELLFIQRATKATDPWSGQMAFPGGRVDPGDVDTYATAERETLEEVGLDLVAGPQSAKRIGSLTALEGGRTNRRFVGVSAHVWWLEGAQPALSPNYEVADVLWVPISTLTDSDRYIDYWYPVAESYFPGIQLDVADQVVWGLTLRFLADLFNRLDQPFIIQ